MSLNGLGNSDLKLRGVLPSNPSCVLDKESDEPDYDDAVRERKAKTNSFVVEIEGEDNGSSNNDNNDDSTI